LVHSGSHQRNKLKVEELQLLPNEGGVLKHKVPISERVWIIQELKARAEFIIVEADVEEVALLEDGTSKVVPFNPADFVLLLPSVHLVVPEVAVQLRNDRTHSRKKRSQDHFFSIPCVDWLACLCEDQVLLPDLIEFHQFFTYIEVFEVWVEVCLVEEGL